MELYLDECLECGQDGGWGNLLGIQPYLVPGDYASAESLRARLGAYLAAARERGWLRENTLVVFPEYCGTWLAAAEEKPAVYRAPTIAAALRVLALARPLAFARAMLAARERDKAAAAIFRLKSARTARLYQQVFGGLAREFGLWVVGGSTILANPMVVAGELRPRPGGLYNVCAVFRPDGSPEAELTRKVYPIASEQPFLSAAPAASLPVYSTPAGRLGVLICADSWYPEPYRVLKHKGAELLAVPSFLDGNGAWERPWRGYNGAPAPADSDPSDAGRLSEGEAWRSYALAGRMAAGGARAGINVFLHGSLWDLGSDSGQSLALGPGGQTETRSRRAALLNLWL